MTATTRSANGRSAAGVVLSYRAWPCWLERIGQQGPAASRLRAETLLRFKAPTTGWDFELYPNPTRDMLTLRFEDDAVKDVAILDVSGRYVVRYAMVTSPLLQIPTDGLAKGAYWVQVIAGENIKIKKLIIH